VKPAYCVQATIVGVDKDSHKVAIEWAQDGESPSTNVNLGAPYANPLAGSGNFSLPAQGSTCFVMMPSDESPPFVVSYTMPTGPGEGQSGGRITMEPGDQALTGNERNFVIARANGTIEIGATGLCKSMYFPIGNILDVYFDELHWKTGLGGLHWTGKSGEAVYSFTAALAPEKAATVYVKAGTTRGTHAPVGNMLNSEGIALEIVVDPEGAGKVFGFHVGVDGNVSMVTEKNVGLIIKGSWQGEIREYVDLLVQQTVNARVLDNVTLDALSMDLKLKTYLQAVANQKIVLDSPVVEAGRGALVPATRSQELILLLQQLCTGCGHPELIAALPWASICSKVVKVA